MKIFPYILFILASTIYLPHTYAQIDALPQKLIQSKGIKKVYGVHKMSEAKKKYNGLPGEEWHFDDQGRLILKKFIFPFQDVVATSNTFIYRYDSLDRIYAEIKVYQNEVFDKSDSSYVNMLGRTQDSTFHLYIYDSEGKLDMEKVFKLGKKDTSFTYYTYENEQKASSIHFNSAHKAQTFSGNYNQEYAYDSLGRLSIVKKSLVGLNSFFFLTSYSYLNDTELIVEKRTEGRAKKTIDGKEQIVRAKDQKEEMTLFKYDSLQNLIKKVIYYDLSDTTQKYVGKSYSYESGRMVESRFIWSPDKSQYALKGYTYIFDEEGLIVEEKRIEEGEWAFSFTYTYLTE